MATLHLIRHAQASFEADDYDQLSPLGERQSRLLGEWMQRCGQAPTRVVIGPLRRHRQTADACLGAMQVTATSPWVFRDGLRELDHLEVLVRHRPQLTDARALRDHLATMTDPQHEFQSIFTAALQQWFDDTTGVYAESWSAFKQRCVDVLLELTGDHASGDAIWVFTSGGPIMAMVQYVLGLSDAHALAFTGTLVNSGVTRLRYRADAINLGTFNGHAHLEVHNEPALITYR